ncbi:MAG: glycosyltransferase family protein [Gammaproteobacteria bacterium]|nr:glycosyltransferase family protein [Gammaproteobacteria bacterium]
MAPRLRQTPPVNTVEAFRQAQALHRAGQLPQAAALYRGIVQAEPHNFDALCMLALLEYQFGRGEESLRLLDRALAVDPSSVNAICNRGNVLMAMRRHEEALASMDRALALQPGIAEVHFNRGVILQALMRQQEALAAYERALALKPGYAEAWLNRGNALETLSRTDEALASYERAAALRPELAPVHFNRGNILRKLGRKEEALESYGRVLALKPDYAEAWNNRGNVLRELNCPEAALPDIERALALRPEYADAWLNRGIILDVLSRREEALDCFRRVIALQPDHAEAHYCISLQRLLNGDFRQGWAEYEWRWKVADTGIPPDYPQPLWLGREDLDGRGILLHAEQGFGDTLQFCRYARLVADRGARVILQVQPSLASLLARLAGPAQIVAQGAPLPPFDLHCPLMSLPLALGTDLQSIPAGIPYLSADTAKVAAWRTRLGTGNTPRVGLAWSGRPTHRNDTNRSIRLQELAPLLDAGATFVSLQKEVREEDRASLASMPGIRHFGDALQDYDDTAALIECLDLVVTVDTSVAHLAGALGKPVWILLPSNPDWRWLLQREDSPWYPTARLFRQARINDWNNPISNVASALVEFLRHVRPRRVPPS